jgi:hypothetical protein
MESRSVNEVDFGFSTAPEVESSRQAIVDQQAQVSSIKSVDQRGMQVQHTKDNFSNFLWPLQGDPADLNHLRAPLSC